MKRNYYAEAIDILTSTSMEYRKVIFEIAKSHPAIFVKAYKKAYPDIGLTLKDYAALIHDNQPIAAIKLYRERTGLGLKESKEFIDKLRAKMGLV